MRDFLHVWLEMVHSDILNVNKIEAQPPYYTIPTMSYTIQFYVNGYLTSRVEGLSPNEAYTQAVSGEALNQIPGSRWHAMLRPAALERLDALLEGESLRVCWQSLSDNTWSDTEHVLIIKDPVGIHMQTPAPPPAPILLNTLLGDIHALINNMIINQDNQQNLINNIRNRLIIMNNPNATYNNNPNATNVRG